MIVQNDSSPEQYTENIFRELYRMLRSRRIALHYLDKAMMKKIGIPMIRPT